MYDAMCLITRLLVKKVPRTLLVPPDSIEQSVQHEAVYECSPTTTGTTTKDPVQNYYNKWHIDHGNGAGRLRDQ